MAKSEVSVNGQSKAVQEASDEIVLLLLAELHKQIDDRIKNGAGFKDTTLLALTKEFRQLAQAIKKPAATLAFMQAPQLPQYPEASRRDHQMERGVQSPEHREKLLASQDAAIDALEDGE